MKDFEEYSECISKFFEIQTDKNFSDELFLTLKKIIPFDSGYIFYTNSNKPEYSYNPQIKNINEIKTCRLVEDLKLKNTVFGKLIITAKNFTEKDKKLFKTCSLIIANITKDAEISKIIKMQMAALQEGYLEITKSNEKILKSEEIKSKFLSHVSHELRTPLNSILGFSDLIELTGSLNSKQKEYLSDIKVAGIHLLGMINEILDMSKLEAGKMKLNITSFDISIAIKEVVNILKPLLEKKEIELIANIENIIVNCDYQKIQQILFNLMSNAIKYSPQKGQIIITVKSCKQKVIISVEDNGIGIPKSYHKKIFNKFEQLENGKENSTGLGLSITKELVKMHKGKIYLNSSKGAEFIVEIPYCTQ